MKQLIKIISALILWGFTCGLESCSNKPEGLSVSNEWQTTEINGKSCKYKLFPGSINGNNGAYLEVIAMPDYKAAFRIFDGNSELTEPGYFHLRIDYRDGWVTTVHLKNENGLLIDDPALSFDPMEAGWTWLYDKGIVNIDGYGNGQSGKSKIKDLTFEFKDVDLSGFGE